MVKKALNIIVIVGFLSISFASTAFAEDAMEKTLRDSLYGGAIGALLGAAVMLLTDEPEDHWDYIPTGAGVGVLLGAAYGLATSGTVQSVGEIDEEGKFTLNFPTFKGEKILDMNANSFEYIGSLDIFNVKF